MPYDKKLRLILDNRDGIGGTNLKNAGRLKEIRLIADKTRSNQQI
tara:strand:- start:118 stop:252 length:135 start_codon:yes stop_codon:yes gene_type:complete